MFFRKNAFRSVGFGTLADWRLQLTCFNLKKNSKKRSKTAMQREREKAETRETNSYTERTRE